MTAVSPGANGAGPGELDLTAIFAALPGAAVLLAADAPRFTLLAASDASLAATQRTRESVVGRSLAEAFPDPDGDASPSGGLASLRASLEAAVRTGATQRVARQRYDLQRPDGRWEARYWDAVNVPVRGADGGVRGVLHQTEDVAALVGGEAALARAERRADGILERVSDAHATLDRELRFVSVNAAAERMVGVPRAALLGRTHAEVFPTSAGTALERAYRRVANGGAAERFTHHDMGDGHDRLLEIDAFPTDEGGVAIFWRDVTERRQADAERARLLAEIAAERERLRAVILHMPAPLALLVGPEHRFEVVNDAFRRVSGGGRDVTGLTPREAFPELAGSGIYELYDRVYATGEPWVGRETLVRYDRDGTGIQDSWFDLRFEPLRDADGRVTGILNFAIDVTDQMRARQDVERLLAESERARDEAEAARARSDAVLGSIADAFYLLDRDWRFTHVNAAAEPLLLTTRDQLLGRTLWEAFPEVAGSVFEGPYREAMATGRVTSAEAYFAPLGTWFDVRTYPWSGGLMVHFRDVGARKAAEAERERLLADAQGARAEAEAASRAKSEFLAVMSHELRTPLNAIGGYAELIEMGIRGPVTEQQREDLGRIQRSQRALLSVINEVLNYARLETGAVTYDVTDVPVAEAVAAAEVLVAPQLRAKGLAYTWSGCEPALAVRADRDKLQQILLNLLSNAIKFTNARPGLAGRIAVSCEVVDGLVLIRGRDTGDGVPADQLEAIFEPFVQVNASLTRTQEGTGLGLAISRDLARGMRGDLTAESTPGDGSTFTLALPAGRGAPAEHITEPAAGPSRD